MSRIHTRTALMASCLALSSLASAQSLQVELKPKCPVTTPPAAVTGQGLGVIAGLLIQQVISKGVDIAGSALTAAAKDKVTTLVGESSAQPFYELDEEAELVALKKVGCIVLLTPGAGDGASPEWLPRVTAEFEEVKKVPDFYLEISLEQVKDGDATKATPQFLYVGKSFAPGSGWFRKMGKDYVVAVSLNAEESGASFGAMTFSFKDIDTGKAYVRRQPNGLTVQLEPKGDWPIPARFPKLPETDSIKGAVSGRKTALVSYVEANAILKRNASPPLVKAPVESNGAYHAAIKTLCDRISEANKAAPAPKNEKGESAPRFSDPRCPLALWDAKLAADKASTIALIELDLKWAQAFFDRKCSKDGQFEDQKADPSVPIAAYKSCKVPAYTKGRPKLGGFYAGATVVETSEASAFLKAVASAFNEDKDKLKTVLNDKFNPVRRDELAAEAVTADRDARQKYQLALLKVAQVDAALQEASGGTASSRKLIEIQLAQAKIDANAAARAAGVPAPFPDFD